MDALREEAHAKGGIMLSHLGNHEWMNVIGEKVRVRWLHVYINRLCFCVVQATGGTYPNITAFYSF